MHCEWVHFLQAYMFPYAFHASIAFALCDDIQSTLYPIAHADGIVFYFCKSYRINDKVLRFLQITYEKERAAEKYFFTKLKIMLYNYRSHAVDAYSGRYFYIFVYLFFRFDESSRFASARLSWQVLWVNSEKADSRREVLCGCHSYLLHCSSWEMA